jgi:NADP-dependent 3-hydroxy acid dehydrogenase YdfG
MDIVQVEVCYIVMDLTHIETVAQTAEKLPEGFKSVDILVNNAGLALGTAAGHEVDMKVCSIIHHCSTVHCVHPWIVAYAFCRIYL